MGITRTLLLPAMLAAGALLAACGGSGSPSLSNAAASEQAAETKFADFARCLREHGVKAEIATVPGGGRGLKIGAEPGKGGPGIGPQQMQAAQSACARYRPEPKDVNLSPQQKVELEERVQKFARCMRERGVKVEASTQGGAVRVLLHGHRGEAGAANPESPSFQASQKACQGLLPKQPGASNGGPKGSASGLGAAGG